VIFVRVFLPVDYTSWFSRPQYVPRDIQGCW